MEKDVDAGLREVLEDESAVVVEFTGGFQECSFSLLTGLLFL